MTGGLRQLREAGVLDPLDVAFGRWLGQWGREPVALAAALTSASIARGRVCLGLDEAGAMLKANGVDVPVRWEVLLGQSAAVAVPGERAPLVLDDERLYLHRYWCYETRIAARLRELAMPLPDVDRSAIKLALQALLPETDETLDRQALAAVLGARHGLTILSGGPGTGKTTTIRRLVALATTLDPSLSVALAAPTGKAARRLDEVLAATGKEPTLEPQTLHRLLGYNPATQRIVHNADNPLPADLVIVDEASMVDIGLMARLLDAIKAGGRLVLAGDRDQLASVEAGAVFGDICSVAGGFPAEDAVELDALLGASVPRASGPVSPVSRSVALLKRNYRFGAAGIGALARAVMGGNADVALDELRNGGPSLVWSSLASERDLGRHVSRVVAEAFQRILEAESAEAALEELGRFRLLAAERRGRFGVEGLNARVESLLGIQSTDPWYRGRPVLITENDDELGIFNGDFGVVWPNEHGRARLWLKTGDVTRSLSPARLPAHVTAWALTVHKAQGSEFDRIALILPPYVSAVATRELVYTGISRAREGVEVWTTDHGLRRAIATPVHRPSGLAARLSVC